MRAVMCRTLASGPPVGGPEPVARQPFRHREPDEPVRYVVEVLVGPGPLGGRGRASQGRAGRTADFLPVKGY